MSDDKLLCSTCGHVAKPERQTPGSILIEIVLWICFLIPGLIYSLWRMNRRHDVCAKCGSATMLPLDSPVAASFARQHNLQLAPPPEVVPRHNPAAAAAFGRRLGRLFRRR